MPTSTFALLTRTSSCARSSADLPRADRCAMADTRFQYAAFTSAVVCTRLSRSRVSAMSRLIAAGRELLARAVDEQVAHERLRHVRATGPTAAAGCSCSGSCCCRCASCSRRRCTTCRTRAASGSSPAFEVTASVRVAVGIRKLDGGCSWLLRCTPVVMRRPEGAGGRGDAGVADLRIETVGRSDRRCGRAPS